MQRKQQILGIFFLKKKLKGAKIIRKKKSSKLQGQKSTFKPFVITRIIDPFYLDLPYW